MIYEDRDLVTQHILDQHSKVCKNIMYGKPREYQCETCHIMFLKPTQHKLHICGILPPFLRPEKKAEKRTETCPVCKDSYEGYEQLILHYAKSHATEPQFFCDQCDFVSTHSTRVREHKNPLIAHV